MTNSNNNKKRIIFGVLALALLFAAEFLLAPSAHAEVWWQKLKGFHLLLGLAGGLTLMGFAKAIGAFFLYRKEEHYD